MACASVTAAVSRVMVVFAWPADRSVLDMRCSSRLISVSSASNLRLKKASASSGLPACHEPISRSPSAVRTYTVPSSATRPHGSLAVPTAYLLLGT